MRGYAVPRQTLAPFRREAMYALLERHFHGVQRPGFQRDLEDKNWVVLLEDDAGRLHGFSTLHLYETQAGGRPLAVVCSGDTVVDADARPTAALAKAWLDTVLRLRPRDRTTPLYWLLICSAFRTYRFLPLFWREFYPRCDAPTPQAAAGLMRRLAEERWGPLYDAAAGIVRFPHPQVPRGGDVAPGPARLADPHVSHFVRLNPGHVRGDELVCLTEIATDNLTAAGHRILRAVERSRQAVEAG